MINRTLIRQKVVQQTYAFYQNGTHKLDLVEKDLFYSLSKSYDLYLYMLELMVELNHIAERTFITATNRYNRLHDGTAPSPRFINNQFIAQLEKNRQLRDFAENQKKTWANEEDYVRRLYKRLTESEVYKEWMDCTDESDYEEDKRLWRRIYMKVIVADEELDHLLEEKSLFWNDDRFIVDSFVIKTIKSFEKKHGAEQPLLPEYSDDDGAEFARRLLRSSLLSADTYRAMISKSLRNWDIDRLALMDLYIMQTALAEMLSFSQIPISVTINEYVDIAKYYSTPQSASYINGMLDAIARRLIDEGKLKKEMGKALQPTPEENADTLEGEELKD
ncbi:MAG: transcription antitermination factor NusB [Bacteroidales bacterium]|nr:transcription antitermination factor NusB [Bacteroidales bacterium]